MSKDAAGSPPPSSIIILDLGGHTAKLGLASNDDPRLLPNCIYKAKSEKKRQFISSQITECKDQHQLFHMYPFTGGFLTNWELQERLLDYFFGEEVLNVDTAQSHIILTEPYFNLQSLKRFVNEALFEEYAFESAFVCPPAYLSAFQFRAENPDEPTCLVVDSGHSFSHVVPVVDGKIVWANTVRVPVGGKILTNHLKQRITFQQINVMDETHVINHLKDLVCFVSSNLREHFGLATSSFDDPDNGATRTFVLPDYVSVFEGYLKPVEETFTRPSEHEQLIRLSADRFVVPETLFRPSIIGDPRMGIAEAAVDSIKKFSKDTQLYLFRNLVLTGGNCNLPGFKERFVAEVGPEVPEFGEVEAMKFKDPMLTAWYGGKTLATSGSVFDQLRVTKAEYDEHGENICERRFIRSTPKQRNSHS